MSGPSATPNTHPFQNQPTWSRTEKVIARRVFDAALSRELHDVIQKTKQMANGIQRSSDLWDLEKYLTQPQVISTTLITATVPSGATSGRLEVMSPNFSLRSNVPFFVRP